MTHSGQINTLVSGLSLRGLNPSFAGWPTLGLSFFAAMFYVATVLIPLLLDGPLWGGCKRYGNLNTWGLNPSFAGWPTLGLPIVDVQEEVTSLNPSFAGWPTLGFLKTILIIFNLLVLIPLLLDDPLWGDSVIRYHYFSSVLIPLLLDDPLWEYIVNLDTYVSGS